MTCERLSHHEAYWYSYYVYFGSIRTLTIATSPGSMSIFCEKLYGWKKDRIVGFKTVQFIYIATQLPSGILSSVDIYTLLRLRCPTTSMGISTTLAIQKHLTVYYIPTYHPGRCSRMQESTPSMYLTRTVQARSARSAARQTLRQTFLQYTLRTAP